MDAEFSDIRQFSPVAYRWMSEAIAVLAPEIWESLLRSAPLRAPGAWDSPHGAPGTVWGTVTIESRSRGKAETKVFSEKSFEWLISELEGNPTLAVISLSVLDSDGLPSESGENQIIVMVDELEGAPRFKQFQVVSSLSSSDAPVDGGIVCDRWVSHDPDTDRCRRGWRRATPLRTG